MNYDFPWITNVKHVWPLVGNDDNFEMQTGDGFMSINYRVLIPGAFPEIEGTEEERHVAKIKRECRGIAFCAKTGDIISRPFHKFFNHGERNESKDISLVELTSDVEVLNKLDGSMVHPLYLKTGTRLATRRGVTGISMMAETFVASRKNYMDFLAECRQMGVTPIFEYMSRENRVVLDYAEPNLVFLAARSLTSGVYVKLDDLLAKYEIPSVGPYMGDLEALQDETGIEGVVLRWPNGHMLKVKTSWYVALHRFVGITKHPISFLQFLFDESHDDVYSNLSPDLKPVVEELESTFLDHMVEISWNVVDECIQYRSTMSRKEFALSDHVTDPIIRGAMFQGWDVPGEGVAVYNAVMFSLMKSVKKNVGKPKNFEKVIEILEPFLQKFDEIVRKHDKTGEIAHA